MPVKAITFVLNGEETTVHAYPGEMLVDILRETLELTGTKVGCRAGDCGACTVILNGEAVNSCLLPIGKVAGAELQTIEGVASGDELHPVQQAMLENGAVQCGFCFPGMVMSAKALLDHNESPSPEEIKTALTGNICRCTGYAKIEEAVGNAAHAMRPCTCNDEGGCQHGHESTG